MSLYRKNSNNDPIYRANHKTFLDKFSHCRICGEWVIRSERSLDHIIPMWRFDGDYWERHNQQMICISCHSKKTAIEGAPKT